MNIEPSSQLVTLRKIGCLFDFVVMHELMHTLGK